MIKEPVKVLHLAALAALLAACSAGGDASRPAKANPVESVPTVTGASTLTPSATTRTLPPATETPAESTSAEPDLGAGLVAHFPFDGSLIDLIPEQTTGRLEGGEFEADRDGRAAGALVLDGVDDYAAIPHGDGLGLTFQATFSVWVLPEKPPTDAYYTIFEKGDPDRGGHARYGLWLRQNRVTVCVEPNNGDPQRCLESEEAITNSAWHHLVGIYDGAALVLIIDGQQAGRREFSRSGISRTAFELFIGVDLYNDPIVYTPMAIDDLRIYRRVLTPEEIERLWTGGP